MNDMYVLRADHIAARMLGGEMMIMSAADSSLYVLNETASVVWQSADGVTPLSKIVRDKVCAEFDVAPDVALEDAVALVKDLAAHGILVISDCSKKQAESAD
jgi:hypothetical protein